MKKQFLLPYLFCLAVILGPAYNMYVHYDFSHSSDTESYLKMCKGDFNVNPVHRYRYMVPLAAKVVSLPLQAVYTKLWPHRAESMWPLQLAFFIVNSFLVAFYGWIVYRLLRLYSNQLTAILIGLVAVLTSRWVAYIAGLPLTDSLYLVAIAALLYSIKTDNKILFVLTVLLGGLMKESFLLFAPLILLAGPFNWYIRAGLIALSVCIVFGEHAIIDAIFPFQEIAGVESESLVQILMRTSAKTFETALDLLTVRGIGEVFTVLGIFTFLLMYGVLNKDCRSVWKTSVEKYYWVFFGCILIHVLISGDAARMFYFGSAFYGILIVKVMEAVLSKSDFEALTSEK
jgi:hypothetical protein